MYGDGVGSRYRCGGKQRCCRRRRSAAPPGGITRPRSRSARASTTSVPASNPACGWAAGSRNSASSRIARSVSSNWKRCSPAACTPSPDRHSVGRGGGGGVTGFDLTFSAPKSVSVLWALGGATAQTHVAQAHRAAVLAALAYLDSHAALSRRGTDGVEQVRTGGFAAALFDHRTSRAGDPQLHTHALVPNKLLCADGIWRTVDGHELFHHKKAAGVLYQAALRAELHSRLGVTFGTPSAHGQAEILGVPKEVMTAWSKRTAQIAAEAAPLIADYETTLAPAATSRRTVGSPNPPAPP